MRALTTILAAFILLPACYPSGRTDQIMAGQTKEEVIQILGHPDKVLYAESSLGIRGECYLYEGGDWSADFEVIFFNDIVLRSGAVDLTD